jgi:transposase InsO family protein
VLRTLFARRGLPARMRVDNGAPWGGWNDLPTALALWLAGLGVATVWNPPRRPQDNGVVERSQRTGKAWAEPGRCADARELQERLDEMDAIQREAYPAVAGRSRAEAYPGLEHSGRAYSRQEEQRVWDLQAARRMLARMRARRKVDRQGRISLYDRGCYVGIAHQGRMVDVSYDPDAGEWVVSDEAGHYLCRLAAPETSRERILALDITYRPAAQNLVAGLHAQPTVA